MHPAAPRLVTALLLLAALLAACTETPDVPATRVPRPTRTPAASAPTRAPAAPTRAPAQGRQASWTVLIYLDGDNNLEESALDDFREMAQVGSTRRVNIVVQLDRISSREDWDDRGAGNWKGAKRFRVEKGMQPTADSQLEDIGEVNMGDPDTLVDFVGWGVERYPAERYALIFWDHGASWPGVAGDDTSDGDLITLPELTDALARAQKATGVKKFDILGFDACLMSQLDVLQAVAPYGRVAIGSADLEPGEGWAWNAWLDDVVSNPGADALAIAPVIVKSFMDFYRRNDETSVTLAAWRLDRIDELTGRVDTLSEALLADMRGSYRQIGKARKYAAEYGEGDASIGAIDLGYFAKSLAREEAGDAIVDAAKDVERAIRGARITHGRGSDHPNGSGISIYFPRSADLYADSKAQYLEESPLAPATDWEEFLAAFYRAGRGQGRRSLVSEPTLSADTASLDAPVTLSATVSGEDTAFVYTFVGRLDPAGDGRLDVLQLDYLYPPGAAGADAPSWPAGASDVQLVWPATVWYLSNGADVTQTPFEPLDYGSDVYSVDGTYRSASTGTETPASIEFEVAEGRGRLTHVWAFDRAGDDRAQPYELEPAAGDSFTPSVLTYSGAAMDEGEADGEPITFGSGPLLAFEAPAPAGDYVVGLLVENVAGTITDQYAEVAVEGAGTPAPPAAVVLTSPEAGAAAGTLGYQSDALGFRLDYPAGWDADEVGGDAVVFSRPDEESGAFLSVAVFEVGGAPADATRDTVAALLEELALEDQFALAAEPAETAAGGLPGLGVAYTYVDGAGAAYRGAAVVATGDDGRTYLISWEAPEAELAAARPELDAMLASFAPAAPR